MRLSCTDLRTDVQAVTPAAAKLGPWRPVRQRDASTQLTGAHTVSPGFTTRDRFKTRSCRPPTKSSPAMAKSTEVLWLEKSKVETRPSLVSVTEAVPVASAR